MEAVHRIRDVSFGPPVVAVLGSFAVSRHHRAGEDNIAHAYRRTARHPIAPFQRRGDC
jgi:hypothetical protein